MAGEEAAERTGEELVAILEDEERKGRDRVRAAGELVELCRRDAAARARFGMRFLTLLTDRSAAVRGEAVVGAVLCDEELAHVERVAKLLDDEKPGVRLQAVHVLAPLGKPELRESLARRLADDDVLVRVAAAAALSLEGDVRAGPVLVRAIDERLARFDALLALARAPVAEAEEPARRTLRALLRSRFERVAAAGVLAALGKDDGRAHLLERAERGTEERPLAVELLGELAVPGAAELLGRLASRREDPARGAALRALAALGDASGVELCAKALADETEDPDIRADAVEGLLLAGTPEAHAALEAAATSATPSVRAVSTEALALFGRERAELRLHLPLSGGPEESWS